MPSRSRRSASPVSSRPSPVLIAIVLVVIGATAALGFERLVPGVISGSPGAARPTATDDTGLTDSAEPAADSAAPTDVAANASAGASDSPAPSPSPVAPILDAAMPRSLNGTALTVETDLGSTILGTDPYSRSFVAAISTLGAKPEQLEIGYAYDAAGALPVTILGFRIAGVTAAKLRPLVLGAWLSSGGPGVTTATVTVAGTSVTRVSYGDQGDDEYVLTRADIVFIAETSDPAVATAAVQAITAAGPASSAAPSPSPSAT